MKIEFVEIQNFRKLKSCRVDIDSKETVFVGANNSGKTSAMDALILFLKEHAKFTTRDFTLSNWKGINAIGKAWLNQPKDKPLEFSIDEWKNFLPRLDVWIKVDDDEIHHVSHLIPTLDWKDGLIGIALRLEPKKIEDLYTEFTTSHLSAKEVKTTTNEQGEKVEHSLKLWPTTMWDFLERKLSTHFSLKAFILDPTKLEHPINAVAQAQIIDINSLPIEGQPFAGLIKIDIINAQRGFSDPNSDTSDSPKTVGNLSSQMREYYSKHLNPADQPSFSDIAALQAIEDAQSSFDQRLQKDFSASLRELETLNYPGFGNPSIKISSRISAIDGLNHSSAVQFDLLKPEGVDSDYPLSLPEKYNGLGYQNLISMVFKLIRFRDEWMQIGKSAKQVLKKEDSYSFERLHLVLVEEPEAHLHAQVQQVFIRRAYSVLRTNDVLKGKEFSTQLVVSTHSNHVAHEIEFTSLRYFRRSAAEKGHVPTSCVVNLSKTFGEDNATTKFAKRYLRSTHCDLFFADAVILIEGAAERMLVPHFITNHYETLASSYISLLEIGGSHAHTLRPLIEDLGIVTLIITDLDSAVKGSSGHATKRKPELGKKYITANATLKDWIPGIGDLDKLITLEEKSKISETFPNRVAYQTALDHVAKPAGARRLIPYTFEDALALENLSVFKKLTGNGLLGEVVAASQKADIFEVSEDMYNAVTKSGAIKAEFGLELLFLEDPKSLKVPKYIADGLEWLSDQLSAKQKDIVGS